MLPYRVQREPTRVDELIDDLAAGIEAGRVVILTEDQALRFYWYVSATSWEWMES